MSRLQTRFFATKDLSMQEAEVFGADFAKQQRDIMFWIGDLARYAERKWPDTHEQVWPEWVSPGLIARAKGVAQAYPKQADRQHEATYTQYMQVANRPDRQARLEAIVNAGQTSDESRKAATEERAEEHRPRWLIAFDVHLFVHQWYHSGASLETAMQVSRWIQRTVERLREKGLTDVACCFDGRGSFRKELTMEWEHKYKGERGPKEPELVQQLQLVRELLDGFGFACVTVEGYESDDCMASYAAHFPGKVTLVSTDKDMRQCLSDKCNLLLRVEWAEDEFSGELAPSYEWVTADSHTSDGLAYNSVLVQGIPPDQWVAFQSLAGDPVDNVKGAVGVGATIAADLIKAFGTPEAAIQAARDGDERIKPAKRQALIEFEAKLEVTRKLVNASD